MLIFSVKLLEFRFLLKMCEPCNSFLAEVRESQGTLLKKIGCKPCIDNHNYKNSLQNVYKNKVYKNEDFFTFYKNLFKN